MVAAGARVVGIAGTDGVRGAGVVGRRRRRPRGAVDEARRVLARLRAGAHDADGIVLAAEVSALLRRVCVSLWPREQAAGLTGDAWLVFLDRVRGGDEFSRGPGRLLIQAPYRPGVTGAELVAVLDLCEQWLAALQRQPREQQP